LHWTKRIIVCLFGREYRALSTTSIPSRPSLSQTPPAQASTSIISARPADGQKLKVKCASRQSLIDTVTSKFQQSSGGVSGLTGVGAYMGNGRGSDAKKKSRGSMAGKLLSNLSQLIACAKFAQFNFFVVSNILEIIQT